MPMDKFWIPLLATLVLLPRTRSSRDPRELIRAVGESVTFRTPNTTAANAFWRFGNDPIVTASHEYPPQALFSTDKFKKRFAVSEKGRALSISQLTLEDSGIYFVTIGEKTFTFNLHVYNQLAEPTVTCEAQNCSGGSCHFSLRCSASGTGLGQVSYTWRVGDQPWDEGSTVLWVNKSSSKDEDEEEEEPLTCTARNPVSSRNVTVTTPDMLCTETSTHLSGPGALFSSRITTALTAGFGVVVILSALLVLLLSLYKHRGWKKFSLPKSKPTDTEVTAATLYAEVGPSQQRSPTEIKAKPTGEESSTSIYSLVKSPEQVHGGTAENASGLDLV